MNVPELFWILCAALAARYALMAARHNPSYWF